MVSGADMRQALEAGLWKALVDDSDRAAMRATNRDARDMSDALHDTAVLPVGPGTWCSAADIAAYHRRLGAVRSLHVRYCCSAGAYSSSDSLSEADQSRSEDGSSEDGSSPVHGSSEDFQASVGPLAGQEDEAAEGDAHAAQFMEAYSAALGAALPATDCSIDVAVDRQLPVTFVAALLQRVVPGLERLHMALGSYNNLEQLLQALAPCTRMRGLWLLPAPSPHGLSTEVLPRHLGYVMRLSARPGVLDALCGLTHLHTLSGPWWIQEDALQRLCCALPSLATLGFQELRPPAASCECNSQQLHTLAGWDGAATKEGGHPAIIDGSPLTLPAVQRLEGVRLVCCLQSQADLLTLRDIVQRFAACARDWTLAMVLDHNMAQHAAQALPAGCLAPLQHLHLAMLDAYDTAAVAAMLGCLVSAAPNLATLLLKDVAGFGREALTIVTPLRQAASLHTLHLAHEYDFDGSSSGQHAAALEGVVRCLAAVPGAEGEGARCRALQRVLLFKAPFDVVDACRHALEKDGINVSVEIY